MTDKEMAEKEYEKLSQKKIEHYCDKAIYVTGFLDGLKLGRTEWHDLRKDSNDLPNGYRVVLNQVGMTTQYDPDRGFLGFGGAGIIAWCKIPVFDKE